MIEYVVGDATAPNVDGTKIIAHVCNDIGAWGKGFVVSISQRYPKVEKAYRSWHNGETGVVENSYPRFALGEIQLVNVLEKTYVANMIAQHGIRSSDGIPPIRYDALSTCLMTLRTHAERLCASVHMPRIGCGLAGGKWSEIEKMVEDVLAGKVKTYVYDFKSMDKRTVPWNK